MHLALTLNPFIDSDLQYAQQLGVNWIVGDLPAWDFDTLAAAKNRVEKSGLYLGGLGCLPASMVADVLLGQPEQEGMLDRICQIITDAGKLGIPSIGYKWPVDYARQNMGTTFGRGESISGFYKIYDRQRYLPQSSKREEMWQALSTFLKQVLPEAEAAGVRLTYQTDISLILLPETNRILDKVDELDRLFQVIPSPNHGLDLDHGFLTQVLVQYTDLKDEEIIQHFCQQKRVFAVRMRGMRRTMQCVEEIFLDENKLDIFKTLQAYRKAGYDGPVCPIPAPAMTDDTEWQHKGYAFSIGYLRGLLQAIR